MALFKNIPPFPPIRCKNPVKRCCKSVKALISMLNQFPNWQSARNLQGALKLHTHKKNIQVVIVDIFRIRCLT